MEMKLDSTFYQVARDNAYTVFSCSQLWVELQILDIYEWSRVHG